MDSRRRRTSSSLRTRSWFSPRERMPAMSTPRLFRVILPVDDIEPAAAFYAELLGQSGMRVSGGRHYFRCGDVMLAVYSPKGDGDRREPRPNWDHVYFCLLYTSDAADERSSVDLG